MRNANTSARFPQCSEKNRDFWQWPLSKTAPPTPGGQMAL